MTTDEGQRMPQTCLVFRNNDLRLLWFYFIINWHVLLCYFILTSRRGIDTVVSTRGVVGVSFNSGVFFNLSGMSSSPHGERSC